MLTADIIRYRNTYLTLFAYLDIYIYACYVIDVCFGDIITRNLVTCILVLIEIFSFHKRVLKVKKKKKKTTGKIQNIYSYIQVAHKRLICHLLYNKRVIALIPVPCWLGYIRTLASSHPSIS